MKQDKLHDALNFLDEDMIEAVDVLRRKKRPAKSSLLKWGSLAACLCVAFIGVAVWRQAGEQFDTGDSSGNAGGTGNGFVGAPDNNLAGNGAAGDIAGVSIPKTEVTLEAGTTADMLAFFIYQGRSYVQYERIDGAADLVGEYLGTATGLIDEWTPKEGYVELAGSISGDFYAVKGYDSSFMLCMKEADGSVSTYINDNGFSLNTGAELFEDRLHLAGNYHTVEYQTREDWYHGNGEPIALAEEHRAVAEQFVEAVNQAAFMYTSDVPLEEGERNIYDREIYHLFFRMNNGMTVHMRLYEGGYVRFQGLIPVCVKVDEAVFEELVSVLEGVS